MIFVEREPILEALNKCYEKTDGKYLSKTEKLAILQGLIDLVSSLEGFDPYNEDPDHFYAPPAHIVTELEPIAPHGKIGKENYYCSHCKERVKRKDHYCRHCGHDFLFVGVDNGHETESTQKLEEAEKAIARAESDIKAYNACIDAMIAGGSPCDWCEDQCECQLTAKDSGRGCAEWWLRYETGEKHDA